MEEEKDKKTEEGHLFVLLSCSISDKHDITVVLT